MSTRFSRTDSALHGGGLSIASFKAQIEYLRQHYKLIAMDSRD